MTPTGTAQPSGPWWRTRPPSDTPGGTLAEIDVSDLVDLRRSVLRDGREDLPATYPSDGEPTSLHLGVTDSDGAVVGGVTVVVDPWPGVATLRLALMAVDHAAQGRGIGRCLVAAVQERAGEAGLDVRAAARVAALGFYTGLGFVPREAVYIGPMDLPHQRILWRTG